jgi:hypothetical protein
MYKKFVLPIQCSFLVVLFLTCATAHATFYFFDGKLESAGKIEQKAIIKYNMVDWEKGKGKYGYRSGDGRMENPASFKTHFHIDANYHLYKTDRNMIDIYTLWEWFYDFAPDMRHNIHDGMHSRDRNRYQTPHGQEMCRELYINIVNGPWTFRIGKQMVVWGETSLKRTADVVNPLDSRSHMMGVDDWEDFKKGLWMVRTFYQTSLKNDLTPEIIWVPHDIKVMDIAPEGSLFNTQYSGGFFSQLQRRWKYDEPKARGVKDSQGGIRLRGYNWDWDWTILWYNGFDPAPVQVDWGQRGKESYKPTTAFGWAQYPGTMNGGIAGINLWAGEYNVNYLQGDPLPKFPTDRGFKYYRTDNYGATAVKHFDNVRIRDLYIPTKTTARIEFTFKEGVHMNRIKPGPSPPVYGLTKKDIIGYALELSRDWMIPYIRNWNGERSVDTTLSLYQDWIMSWKDHHLGLSGYDRGGGDKYTTTLGFSASTDWLKQDLDTRFNTSYCTSGYGDFWTQLMYSQGDHLRYTVLWRTSWSNAGPNNHKGDNYHARWTEKDDTIQYLMVKLGYLF